jgi:hypothetical protein
MAGRLDRVLLLMRVDLTRGKFPNGRADRHPFLADEQKTAVCRLRRDYDSSLAMRDRPREWFRAGG